MKKLSLILISLLLMALLFGTIGCGGDDDADTTPEPTATEASTPEPTATEAPATATPVATPTATAEPTTPPSMTAIPCRFHGTVMLDGASVVDGIEIIATIGEDTYSTTTPSDYGDSTYLIQISPPSGTSYDTGTAVTFKVNNRDVAQTGSWETGGNIELDLTAG